jgi:hypothetical protein
MRGGRRQQTWSAPVSWREADVLDAARAVWAARAGITPSRADWLLNLAEQILRAGSEDQALSAFMRQRATRALAQLAAERAEVAAHPARPGRPPRV